MSDQKSKHKPPPGFVKCEVCGGHNGSTERRNLKNNHHWGAPLSEEVEVQCLCHGLLCRQCEKVRFTRPGKNEYCEKRRKIVHQPGMRFMAPYCQECMYERGLMTRPSWEQQGGSDHA